MAERNYSAEAESLLSAVGQRVRARRRGLDLTLKQLAAASGLSERFLGGLETGRANISLGNLADLAVALRVSVVELVGGAPAKARPLPGVVTLLGLRGAGKSTVGARLAQRLRVPFVELDRLVEQEAGLGLGELFTLHGEGYFRQLESAALRKVLATHPRAVVATGGGLVTNAEAFEVVLGHTRSVWLRASADEHWQRVVTQGDLRPMRDRPQARAELKRRLKEREPLYARAHLTCLTSGRPVEEVVEGLAAWVRQAPANAMGAAAAPV